MFIPPQKPVRCTSPQRRQVLGKFRGLRQSITSVLVNCKVAEIKKISIFHGYEGNVTKFCCSFGYQIGFEI
jgi:hypothetical protein